ncbi:MAG: QcrA and Rieske domain-containing protein [Planctomycetota bacterium]|jgi:nitrite reductase/ring-hydroxylating ferredoxin subunit
MNDSTPPSPDRRSFLGKTSSFAMAGGLLAGYGTFFGYAGRYLYPAEPTRLGWMFVTETKRMEVGDSMTYRTPAGAAVVVTRQKEGNSGEDFLALSGTCPHLGCQVHWEPQNDRFFCPCHNGVFTPEGKGIGGPPGDAGQSLPRYPLKVEDGLLYIEVPLGSVASAPGRKGGHDDCLKGGLV